MVVAWSIATITAIRSYPYVCEMRLSCYKDEGRCRRGELLQKRICASVSIDTYNCNKINISPNSNCDRELYLLSGEAETALHWRPICERDKGRKDEKKERREVEERGGSRLEREREREREKREREREREREAGR